MSKNFSKFLKQSRFILLPASLPLITGIMFTAFASGCASDPPMVTTTTDRTTTTQVAPVVPPSSTETITRSQSSTP